MKRLFAAAVLFGFFAAPSAYATPDFVSVAGGGYDFDKGGNQRDSPDYRFEYRWGASLLPLLGLNADWFAQLHPSAGFEGNFNGMSFTNGGLNLDIPLGRHIIFTWGEAAGLYGHGNDAQPLGSSLEFRSQLELGWRFDNEARVTAFISHMSNAGLADNDPGAETIGAYLHLPTGLLQ